MTRAEARRGRPTFSALARFVAPLLDRLRRDCPALFAVGAGQVLVVDLPPDYATGDTPFHAHEVPLPTYLLDPVHAGVATQVATVAAHVCLPVVFVAPDGEAAVLGLSNRCGACPTCLGGAGAPS